MFEEFAGKGSIVKYLNANGSDTERERANQVIREGQELIVKETEINNWSSYYYFEGFDWAFNTVMFEVIEHKPVLVDNWFVTQNRLVGMIGGQSIFTSEIQVIDEESGVCRTKNSIYYLGRSWEVRPIFPYLNSGSDCD